MQSRQPNHFRTVFRVVLLAGGVFGIIFGGAQFALNLLEWEEGMVTTARGWVAMVLAWAFATLLLFLATIYVGRK